MLATYCTVFVTVVRLSKDLHVNVNGCRVQRDRKRWLVVVSRSNATHFVRPAAP